MANLHRNLGFSFPSLLLFLSVFICVHPWLLSEPVFAQEAGDQEVAVNLAEGRVVICATKDAIVLAAMDAHGEAGSHAPEIAILSAERIGVMLGAVEWVQPDSKDKPIRLDNEFHSLIAAALNTGSQADNGFHASDIESIGIAVLERLRVLAGLLHHKINLGEDEPLIRIVLAGYVRDYGAEAWRSTTTSGRTPWGTIFGGRASCARATTSSIHRKRASQKRSWRSAIRRRTAPPASPNFSTCFSRMIRAWRKSARRMRFRRSP